MIDQMYKSILGMVLMCFCLGSLGLVSCAGFGGARGGLLQAKVGQNQIDVFVGDKLFTSYKTADSQKYPYFWPVNGPASGQSVTTESSEPYPHHHSLFFACDFVNGANYWQEGNERGQIVSRGVRLLKASGQRVVFEDTCHWRVPGQAPVIEDLRRVTISAPEDHLRFIDFDITLKAFVPVTIKETNHSLFSARMTPELNVENGGTLVNAEGGRNRQGTAGVASAWCDYYGSREGLSEGLAILQHPTSQWFPTKWATRDYGYFSPTPMQWLEGGELRILPGDEPLRMSYRVVVHEGDTEAIDLAGIFEQYSKNDTPSQ